MAKNPLPLNIDDRNELPSDRGWWGYSFYNVPERESGPTELVRLPRCTIVPYKDEAGEFWVTVLNEEGQSLLVREMALRKPHHQVLRGAKQRRIRSGVWITERVYDNYSHWFTAHLPKIVLLQKYGLADEILLPRERPTFIDDSLRMSGFDPNAFSTFSHDEVLRIDRLTLLNTDRFRPELLRLASEAITPPKAQKPVAKRRVYISREGATRRRLLNEDDLKPILEHHGFETVRMESLTFKEQVELMQETEVLCALHGAGLTNMMFCQEGTHIVELADLSFPNPNFYAVASAMQHRYWMVPTEAFGDMHPLHKDQRVDPQALTNVLNRITAT